jgi:hypothetical protein
MYEINSLTDEICGQAVYSFLVSYAKRGLKPIKPPTTLVVC